MQVLQGAHEEMSRFLPLQQWPAFWAHAKPAAPDPAAVPKPFDRLPLPEGVARHAAHALLSVISSPRLRYSAGTRRFTLHSPGPAAAAPDCWGERQLRALLHVAGALIWNTLWNILTPSFLARSHACMTSAWELYYHASRAWWCGLSNRG